MVKETEFYDLLGIQPDAGETDIKRAYRKLALKYHPDKNPGDEKAADMFKQVSAAYECLSDESKRKMYDQYGKKGMEEGGGGGFHDASDIFSMFFGSGNRERGEPKPKDIVHELGISLEDMYTGKTKKIAVTRDRLCEDCKGLGVRAGAAKPECQDCRGRGVQIKVQQIFPGMMQQVQVRCQKCSGSGKIVKPEDVCTGCQGACILKDRKVLEIIVERGAKKGDFKRFVGEGDQSPDMKTNGDILILFAMKPHPLFRRVGTHLFINHTISLKEALCGFDLPIEHLDKRLVVVKIPPGQCIDPGYAWTVSREGMPLPNTGGSQRGNLVIHFEVEFPTSLSESARKELCSVLGGTVDFPKIAGAQKAKLSNFVQKRRTQQRRPVAHDDDDDEGGHPGQGQGVQCQQQ